MKTLLACAVLAFSLAARAQTVTIDTGTRFQTIDGFGTCIGTDATNSWYQQLYFDDMQYSVMRMDLTPNFMPDGGITTDSYCSPWYANANASNLYLPQSDGGCGPDGDCVRTYTGPADYSDPYVGCSAGIAVMGPNIDQNVKAFDFGAVSHLGKMAQLGAAQSSSLGDFKLYGSLWSPAPWVKVTSGNTYSGSTGLPSPSDGTPWPFIWGANFAGGKLDLSGTTYNQFNDGTMDTSALTQFTRLLAAYVKGFQDTYGVRFYALSIQNELDFEEFYNSAIYPLASDYLTALKAVRAEFDAQPDLAGIKIFGPEDVIGDDAYSLYMYGSPGTTSERDKNLAFLKAIASDPEASAAIGGFNIHGYASDGISAASGNSQAWGWWANGWTTSPAAGIPADVPGFTSFAGLTSWMTETSGEALDWLSNDSTGFPSKGAFAIAIGIHETLVSGLQNAFLYWQLSDGTANGDTQSLTDSTALGGAAKYNAMKHFARYIRPNAVRVAANVTGNGSGQLLASAYVLDSAESLTIVLINENATAVTASLIFPATPAVASFQAYTSSNNSYWNAATVTPSAGAASVSVPGYGVVTLYGAASPATATGGTTTGGREGGTTSGANTASAGTSSGAATGATSGSTSGSTSGANANSGTSGGGRNATTSNSGATSGSATTGGQHATGSSDGTGGGCSCGLSGGEDAAFGALLFALIFGRGRRRRRVVA